jgi:hypothetical protein
LQVADDGFVAFRVRFTLPPLDGGKPDLSHVKRGPIGIS